MKLFTLALSAILCLWSAAPAHSQTLDECQAAAERNYPLIKQYDLIGRTTQLTVSNIQKGWLPQVTATAQATLQSDVTAWPDEMQAMIKQMGIDLKGLKRDQYRVGIDVQQTVFDGGAISQRKEVARRQGQVQEAETRVSLYQVRQRVNEMFFALLLIDEQIRLNNDLQQLLLGNEKKLASMLKGGTAAQSDYNNVRAERLTAAQLLTSLKAQRQTLSRMLSTFCGMEVNAPVKPGSPLSDQPKNGCSRPELSAIDARLRLTDAQERQLDAALMPRLSLFAQGFYGYPGYNMFDDMLNHNWSWNGMVGARLTWNIGALYTRKNDKAALSTQRSSLNVQREVFLFNNNLQQLQQNENVERYRQLMADDDELINLRSSIRKAAESKLSHGIIDVNDLLREINAENAARVQQRVHEIEMLKEIYNLKFTQNDEY